MNPTAAGRPGPTGVSGASLWYKIGQKVHRIKDELANLKSHKIITSWFSIACQSSQTTGMQRWKSITKNYFGWVGAENYARDAGFSQQSRWKGAVLCKTEFTHVSKTKTLLVGSQWTLGEWENSFSIFCLLCFLGVEVRAQHREFSQGARALMLKNLGGILAAPWQCVKPCVIIS